MYIKVRGLYGYFLFVKTKLSGNIAIIKIFPLILQIVNEQKLKKFENIARKLISDTIAEDIEIDHKTYGLINVTDIKLSTDLSYLDVYVSSFKNPDDLTKYMWEHAHHIQKKIGKNLATYKIPKVRFRYDNSGENSQDINSIIRNLEY